MLNICFRCYLNHTLYLCYTNPNLPVVFISLLHYTFKDNGWSSVFVSPPSTATQLVILSANKHCSTLCKAQYFTTHN